MLIILSMVLKYLKKKEKENEKVKNSHTQF